MAAGSHDNDISRNGVNGNGRTGIRLNDPNIVNSFRNVGPTLLDLVSPDRPPYIEGTDYKVMPGSGSGDVTAEVIAIDVSLHPSGDLDEQPRPGRHLDQRVRAGRLRRSWLPVR